MVVFLSRSNPNMSEKGEFEQKNPARTQSFFSFRWWVIILFFKAQGQLASSCALRAEGRLLLCELSAGARRKLFNQATA